MDQRERIADSTETLRTAIEGMLSELWTSTVAIVEDFNPDDATCSAQPAIKGQVTDLQGKTSWVELPLLIKVPVWFPMAGDLAITFPLKQGDEVLIIFAVRCIDQWWLNGGIQVQSYLRFHDLHDGIALPGLMSKPRVLKNISTTSMQIRNREGSAYIELTPQGVINLKAPGGFNIQGVTKSDSEGTFNNHSVGGHTHTDPQGGESGPAVG
jgi:hypothetical protein